MGHNRAPFKWRRFEPPLILPCVRWYCRYQLSYRDLEETVRERGLSVDHVTVHRWVQRYAPEINKRVRPHLKMSAASYRIDATYVKAAAEWKYLYRAIDSQGETIHLRRSVKSFLALTPGSRQRTSAAVTPCSTGSPGTRLRCRAGDVRPGPVRYRCLTEAPDKHPRASNHFLQHYRLNDFGCAAVVAGRAKDGHNLTRDAPDSDSARVSSSKIEGLLRWVRGGWWQALGDVHQRNDEFSGTTMSALMDVKLRPLLTVFVLTAIATTVAQLFPPARELPPLAILLDLVPFGGAAVATAITTVRLKRVPLHPIRLLIAAYGYFVGALVGVLGLAHLVAVVLASIEQGRQHQLVYSFRFYSLILLGMLLVAAGLMATTESARLARGQRGAWRTSLSVWVAILAINLPLVSLQGFAVLFSVLAALELLLLGGMRRHLDVKPAGDTGAWRSGR